MILEQPIPALRSNRKKGILERFSRVASPGRIFIPQIDGLRFVAIVLVVAYHVHGTVEYHFGRTGATGGLVNAVFASGHFGVHLFFAISGFVLAMPFAKQSLFPDGRKIRLRDYYLRRVTRIEPPYIIHLIFLTLLGVLLLRHLPSHPNLFHNGNWAEYLGQRLAASLVYINGFVFGTHPYPNLVLWSLEIEVQFYLLAPFLAKVFEIATPWKRRTVIVAAMVLSAALVSPVGDSYRIWASLAGSLSYFLSGFLLADLYLTGKLEASRRTFYWDALFPLGIATMMFVHAHPTSLSWLLHWGILFMCVAVFRGRISAAALKNPWIVTMGGMCYTIYLYHFLMISFLFKGTRNLQTGIPAMDLLIQFAVMAPIIIVGCSLLFVLFERPFMKRDWPTRFWNVLMLRHERREVLDLGTPGSAIREVRVRPPLKPGTVSPVRPEEALPTPAAEVSPKQSVALE